MLNNLRLQFTTQRVFELLFGKLPQQELQDLPVSLANLVKFDSHALLRVCVPNLAFQAQIVTADVQQQLQLSPWLSYLVCQQTPQFREILQYRLGVDRLPSGSYR